METTESLPLEGGIDGGETEALRIGLKIGKFDGPIGDATTVGDVFKIVLVLVSESSPSFNRLLIEDLLLEVIVCDCTGA